MSTEESTQQGITCPGPNGRPLLLCVKSWDSLLGVAYFKATPADLEAAGYVPASKQVVMHLAFSRDKIARAYQRTRSPDWCDWDRLSEDEKRRYELFLHELETTEHGADFAPKQQLAEATTEVTKLTMIVEAWGDVMRDAARHRDHVYAHFSTISPKVELGFGKDGPAVHAESFGEAAVKLAALKPNSAREANDSDSASIRPDIGSGPNPQNDVAPVVESTGLLRETAGDNKLGASVGGEWMEKTIAEHVRACEVLISDEQEKPLPQNHVIATLCDSVRMAREYCRVATQGVTVSSVEAAESDGLPQCPECDTQMIVMDDATQSYELRGEKAEWKAPCWLCPRCQLGLTGEHDNDAHALAMEKMFFRVIQNLETQLQGRDAERFALLNVASVARSLHRELGGDRYEVNAAIEQLFNTFTAALKNFDDVRAAESQTFEQALNIYTPKPGECICWKCLDGKNVAMMVTCRTCGNKRCPKASDHELACTGSNEPGQPGSVYADPHINQPCASSPTQSSPSPSSAASEPGATGGNASPGSTSSASASAGIPIPLGEPHPLANPMLDVAMAARSFVLARREHESDRAHGRRPALVRLGEVNRKADALGDAVDALFDRAKNSDQHRGTSDVDKPSPAPSASIEGEATPSDPTGWTAGNVTTPHGDTGSAPCVVGPDAGRATSGGATKEARRAEFTQFAASVSVPDLTVLATKEAQGEETIRFWQEAQGCYASVNGKPGYVTMASTRYGALVAIGGKLGWHEPLTDNGDAFSAEAIDQAERDQERFDAGDRAGYERGKREAYEATAEPCPECGFEPKGNEHERASTRSLRRIRGPRGVEELRGQEDATMGQPAERDPGSVAGCGSRSDALGGTDRLAILDSHIVELLELLRYDGRQNLVADVALTGESLERYAERTLRGFQDHACSSDDGVTCVVCQRDMSAVVEHSTMLEKLMNIYTPQPGECICWKCLDGKNVAMMVTCRTCGNKRCPKASDHELACTGSNEPGQPGSVYADPHINQPCASSPTQSSPSPSSAASEPGETGGNGSPGSTSSALESGETQTQPGDHAIEWSAGEPPRLYTLTTKVWQSMATDPSCRWIACARPTTLEDLRAAGFVLQQAESDAAEVRRERDTLLLDRNGTREAKNRIVAAVYDAFRGRFDDGDTVALIARAKLELNALRAELETERSCRLANEQELRRADEELGKAGQAAAEGARLLLQRTEEYAILEKRVVEVAMLDSHIRELTELLKYDGKTLGAPTVFTGENLDSYTRRMAGPITYRGSVTDLATDVAFELTAEQAGELIQELGRFLRSEPTKFGKARSRASKKERSDGPEVRSDSAFRDGRGRDESGLHREADGSGAEGSGADEPQAAPSLGGAETTGQQEAVAKHSVAGDTCGGGHDCVICKYPTATFEREDGGPAAGLWYCGPCLDTTDNYDALDQLLLNGARSSLGVGKPVAVEPKTHHDLNEYTFCVRCKRFDPAGACPGESPVPSPEPSPEVPGLREEITTAARRVAHARNAGIATAAELFEFFADELAKKAGGQRP